MDLLKGYGSDDSSSSSSDSDNNDNANAATAAPAAASAPKPLTRPPPSSSKKSQKAKRGGGKRILSLGAVLPPEIFDRLTRPRDDDDSSTSSFEGGASSKKKRKRNSDKNGNNSDNENEQKQHFEFGNSKSGGGDRTELNSLLSELRSTPLHVGAKNKKTTAHKSNHDQASTKKGDAAGKTDSGKLGMAFMSFTSSTTTSKKKSNNEVVDVHAVRKSAPAVKSTPHSTKPSPPLAPARPAIPSFSRISTAAPIVNAPQYAQASSMPEYPVVASQSDTTNDAEASSEVQAPSYNNNNLNNSYGSKSRKQRRDEERALRSGQAFQNNNNNNSSMATELHQPSPAEFAPTAHAAAIASRAARASGAAAGGGGSVKNIAMYDPSSGSDVKGLGVTGQHRSKHQINQLMASAISLEAHRAGEAELARLGGGGGSGNSSRADAKRKYGW